MFKSIDDSYKRKGLAPMGIDCYFFTGVIIFITKESFLHCNLRAMVFYWGLELCAVFCIIVLSDIGFLNRKICGPLAFFEKNKYSAPKRCFRDRLVVGNQAELAT